jgi:TonB-linked SusC/RagA family outer membrane protein
MKKPIKKHIKIFRKCAYKSLLAMKLTSLFLIPGIMQATAEDYSQKAPENQRQQIVVTGRVTSAATGESLPGVNIIEKGTQNGAVTNIDGTYTLGVSSKEALLVFSFIGYLTEEIEVGDQTTIDMQLIEDIQKLDEVVVIGYGSQRRSDLTGAVVSVSEDDLKGSINASIEQAMQGRAAGVQVFQNSGQPGGGISVRIRGANSINSSSEPLYVIDGVPVSGDSEGTAAGFDWAMGGNGQTAISSLSTINTADIVSIEILKDASATAIYGSRGANGVVLITTRRGMAGQSKITYDAYAGMQQASKYLEVMNLREYAEYYNEMAELGMAEIREEFLDPSLLGDGTDWQKEIFRNAAIHNHQLAVTGGNEKTQYSVSGGYFKQDGIIVGSNFERYSIRLNLDNQTRKWFKIGNSLLLSHTNEKITLNDSDDGIITTALLQSPLTPLKLPDGSWGGPTDTEYGLENPVAKALDRDLRVNRYKVIGNIYTEINFLKNLKLRSEIGTDITFTHNYGFKPTYVYGLEVNDQNVSRRRFAGNYYWIVKNYLTYDQTFANKHNITAMIGQEAQESRWEGIMGQRNTFVTNDIQELNAGDAESATNEGYKGSNALVSYFGRLNYDFNNRYLITATLRADGSSNFGPDKRWGYFPSFAVAWKLSNESFMQGFTFLSNLKIRAGYGETGNQAIPGYAYGSALASRLSDLGTGFLLDKIPNPQVQWEASRQSNIGIDLGIFDGRIQLTADLYNKQTDNMLIQLPLPNYMGGGSWMGIAEPWVNLGELENKGIEFSLTTHNLSGQLKWSSDFIFSHNKNKVISLGKENAVINRDVQWYGTITRTEVGNPLGQFYGYFVDGVYVDYEDIIDNPKQNDKIEENAGVWPGDLKFKNIDQSTVEDWIIGEDTLRDVQVIDELDRGYIGDPYPDFTFGINNTFSYKNFDLTIYLQGMYGHEIFNFTKTRTENMTQLYLNQLKTVNDRARVEMIDPEGDENDPENYIVTNPDTKVPRAVTQNPNENDRYSDRYVEDGSYLRIKNIALGYALPKSVISKINASRLRVYINIQNLYTFTKYSGYDPEIGAFNQDPLLTGVDNGRYPTSRIFTLGLNLEF